MAEIIINFKPDGKEVVLELSGNSIPQDQLIIGLDFNFENLLVTSIDKLLKRNRIEKSSLKMVKVAPEEGLSSVAFRAAQAVAAAIKS